MTLLEMSNVCHELAEGCRDAIEKERDFTREEELYYNAFAALQDLNDYLVEKWNKEGGGKC